MERYRKGNQPCRLTRVLWSAALMLSAVGCGETPTGIPFTRTTTIEGDGFTRVEGEAEGALLAVIQPDDWNGDLVVLMHGSVPENAPLSLEPPFHWWWGPVIDGLVQRGFGIAFSSYRVNGFAVREGTIDTRTAQAVFAAEFAKPGDTYLVGWSMGTDVGQKLVETSPDRYAGFLSVCGSLAGAPVQSVYLSNARILFDYFFPGVLPGDVVTAEFDFIEEGVPLVASAINADFDTAVKLASVEQLDIRWNEPAELVLGVIGALLGMGGGSLDLQTKADGIPFDNTETVYTSALLTPDELQALNAAVDRFAGDPQALAYIENNYDPVGRPRGTKILSLHTTRDPVVPWQLHAPVYEHALGEAGNQDLWVLRLIDGFGHCEFDFDFEPDAFVDIELAAFDDLVTWVRTGVEPTP